MAPKKKPQKQSKPRPSSSSKNNNPPSSGPRLQISAENENRLRRLLLNSNRPTQPPPESTPSQDSLSKAQKAKKLKAIYENLSCEGFSDDQIELALSSLKDAATFEAALDWLCLNLPRNELPLKFSSGTSSHNEGGSVSIVSVARDDWSPSVDSSSRIKENLEELSVRVKGKADENTINQCQPSQADWIRQYMQQQEEDEPESWEGEADGEGSSKERSYDVIAREYQEARLDAKKAKEKKDKTRQEYASNMVRKLKQELSALGLSDESFASDFWQACLSEDSLPSDQQQSVVSSGVEGSPDVILHSDEATDGGNDLEGCTSKEYPDASTSSTAPVQEKFSSEAVSEDVELGDFFIEDASTDVLPPEVQEIQKKERMKDLRSEKNIEKLEGIWKKGDTLKIPKAVLHQLCQRSGWEAPKFDKVLERGKRYSYAVSVLRKTTGRGKSRKPGGLITLQLPDQNETFESAEDAQNRVAAYALCQLFNDLPVHLMMMEPYASLVLQFKGGELSSTVEDNVEERRAGFVDRILNADGSNPKRLNNISNSSLSEVFQDPSVERTDSDFSGTTRSTEQELRSVKAESLYLRQEQEKKKRLKKYREMLKTRSALPIASMQNEILQLVKENSVLVVCGETGSGKTTQVPQFILDDMIESGSGGHCNIVCTQPRRIAAISVAERVSDERCEPCPGSNGSLVGYQVRLDSARTEKTKLLFCTTGILLRKLAGDKNLNGITHVVVDEVHERSLLGDFLLIVLKNLIEKQSAQGTPKLKVILMSATVDSDLFSSYFGNCPVIAAEGRTHPVTTYFLEDIYESTNYRLASDSKASLKNEASTTNMQSGRVSNHRGKQNLVLSGWGDDSVLSEDLINPYYVPSSYQSFSEQTQRNLRRLNEDVIDYDLLEDLVSHVDETCGEGAILVFLPGVSEIHMLYDRLAASYRFSGPSSDWLLPLHSSVAPTDQKKVFLRPPENIRKVIIATNIAETSITIDDVVYVIDCGKHKENRYNPQKKLSSMVEDWISQANGRQRRGRAGRVKPGICFSLYTRHRFENLMRAYQVPEMLRMPLVELCLQIKLLNLGHINSFLSKALEPPKAEAISSAVSLLYEVGAIEGNEELTPLGHHLAKLPVDVLIGKMLLFGGIFGCLSPILSISAFLSYKSPFIYPKDERENVERAKLALLSNNVDDSGDSNDCIKQSDHLLMAVAYRKWEKILRERGGKAAQQFCSSHFISSAVMYMIKDMRIQFGTLLADIGFIKLPMDYQIKGKKKDHLDGWLSDNSKPFNMYSKHPSVVKAVLCAGLYPNIAAIEQGIGGGALGRLRLTNSSTSWYDGRRQVYIHPSSINGSSKAFQHPFLVFLEKVETNRVFLRDTTIISPFCILLFGGSINVQHQTGLVMVDQWLKLTAPAQTAVLFKELRSAVHSLLKELVRKPENATIVENEVVKSIVHLLIEEDKPPK